jgi:L-lactate dehydrogenase complex protein LldE
MRCENSGVSFVAPSRPDECCGFGGVFAIGEPSVSCAMGRDRVSAHRIAGAQVIVSTDVSCLIHLDGIARHEGAPIRTLHVAEVMAARELG